MYDKKASSYWGARTGCHYLISPFVCLSVCLSVCVCVCVCETFVVFTDCESCTRPISTKPGSMEAGEYGLTRGTCFIASRPEVVAVAGLLWFLLFVLGAAVFRVFSMILYFQYVHTTSGCERPRAVGVDSVKGLRQPANMPTENLRPPIPTRCTIYCAPT